MGTQAKSDNAKKDVFDNRPINPELDKLAAFSAKSDSDLTEGTSTYFRFTSPGTKVDGLFQGLEHASLDPNNPDKVSECAILVDANGERLMFAQTVIVKEIKKQWDKTKETGFPVRIIYKGEVGTGSDKYQSFRILF